MTYCAGSLGFLNIHCPKRQAIASMNISWILLSPLLFFLGEPLFTDQDPGWLLLLCVWVARSKSWPCTLLCWNGDGYDRGYLVSTIFPIEKLKTNASRFSFLLVLLNIRSKVTKPEDSGQQKGKRAGTKNQNAVKVRQQQSRHLCPYSHVDIRAQSLDEKGKGYCNYWKSHSQRRVQWIAELWIQRIHNNFIKFQSLFIYMSLNQFFTHLKIALLRSVFPVQQVLPHVSLCQKGQIQDFLA